MEKFPIKKALLALAVVVIVLAVPLFWIHELYPTTSPFKAISYMNYHRTHPHLDMSQRTIGFAPSWQLDKMQNIKLDHLTDVIFFSLTVGDGGTFATKNSKGEDDQGFSAWNAKPANDLIAKTQIMGGRAGLTVSALNNDKIKNFLSSDANQANLVSAIVKEVTKKHLKLVNIDFEYTGEPDDSLPPKFTAFMNKLNSELDSKAPGIELDINLKARSGRDPGLFEIDKLMASVDRFIVMSYDYYTGGSDSAGPVAPMNGRDDKTYFFDVTTTYEDLLKIMPADKIVMGIPYYGYDWPVKDKTNRRSVALKQSDTNGYVETLSYGRAKAESEFTGENCHFDDLAQSPWCGYTDSETGKDRIAWFENNQSLKVKYDYAKSNNFAGIAIWSLGYDRDYPDLWDLMRETFGK